jgi:hypothetical protein
MNLNESDKKFIRRMAKFFKALEQELDPKPIDKTPHPPVVPAQPIKPKEVSMIQIILNDKTMYDITKTDIMSWVELYQNVHVFSELQKMKGWCDANPTKRKTRRGIKRFIVNWLARQQDKGN